MNQLDEDDSNSFDRLFADLPKPRWYSPSLIWHSKIKPFLQDTKDSLYKLRYPVAMAVPEDYCCPHPYCRAGTPLDDYLNRVPHYLPHKLDSIWFRNENAALMCKLSVDPG